MAELRIQRKQKELFAGQVNMWQHVTGERRCVAIDHPDSRVRIESEKLLLQISGLALRVLVDRRETDRLVLPHRLRSPLTQRSGGQEVDAKALREAPG